MLYPVTIVLMHFNVLQDRPVTTGQRRGLLPLSCRGKSTKMKKNPAAGEPRLQMLLTSTCQQQVFTKRRPVLLYKGVTRVHLPFVPRAVGAHLPLKHSAVFVDC